MIFVARCQAVEHRAGVQPSPMSNRRPAIERINAVKPSDKLKRWWAVVKHATGYDRLSPTVKKVLVAIVGSIVLALGLVMLVLPGPAVIFIPLGLAILASEFRWARRMLARVRLYFRAKRQQFRERRLRRLTSRQPST